MINWDNPRKRRDRLYILAEILDIAKEGSLKTQIMYRANLSFTQLNEYLDLLLSMKLVGLTEDRAKTIYKTTPKGLQYLQNYKEIIELLKNGNSNGKPDIKGGPPIYWVKRTP
ncbi:MAG TPA: winged helix-turn-helix domain-containing protein [Candidatus Krumholzibacteriaceae bacterium]|nr:winged helix-turn-helix domain-containing protein [Candidatus Krumholzibacteriaceae bacterium]